MNTIDFEQDELKLLHRKIGQNVAEIRKSKNISQLDLALSIGYNSTSVIAKAEAGTEGRHFSIEQLYKISELLQIDISEFFKDISQRKNF